ncbi:Protein of unknown function [Gryllus bimaculatus]|nr:Protein of unknown function [Gryllus bimaculatus]
MGSPWRPRGVLVCCAGAHSGGGGRRRAPRVARSRGGAEGRPGGGRAQQSPVGGGRRMSRVVAVRRRGRVEADTRGPRRRWGVRVAGGVHRPRPTERRWRRRRQRGDVHLRQTATINLRLKQIEAFCCKDQPTFHLKGISNGVYKLLDIETSFMMEKMCPFLLSIVQQDFEGLENATKNF